MGKDEFLRSRREREKGGGELLHPCVLMAKKEKEKGIGSNLFEIKDIYTELLLFPFLPAAKPAGYRTESVVLLVVVVVGEEVIFSPDRKAY